jgi:hypothetical protein
MPDGKPGGVGQRGREVGGGRWKCVSPHGAGWLGKIDDGTTQYTQTLLLGVGPISGKDNIAYYTGDDTCRY